MRRSARLLALALILASAANASAKDLRWKSLDVKARLDASGGLSVVETHTMVFDGDWNGGERTFRVFPGQSLALESVTRIDKDGTRHPLSQGDLSAVDAWNWTGPYVLRWRSRLPSDPEFARTELVYEIAYRLRASSRSRAGTPTRSTTTSRFRTVTGRSTRSRCRSPSTRSGSRRGASWTRIGRAVFRRTRASSSRSR